MLHKLFSPAKINLRLKLLGRIADGYHLLSMLNATVSLFDELEIAPSSGQDEFLVKEEAVRKGEVPQNLSDNIIGKALKLFRQEFEDSTSGNFQRYKITLNKKIPTGAGLGGGSSNAATLLRFLARQKNIAISDKKLHTVALRIGSDVPFFLAGGLCWVGGIGENIIEVPTSPLKDYLDQQTFAILKPPFNIPTPAVYDQIRRVRPELEIVEDPFWGKSQSATELLFENDLEPYATLVAPELTKVRSHCPKSKIQPILSGSGSAFWWVEGREDFEIDSSCGMIFRGLRIAYPFKG